MARKAWSCRVRDALTNEGRIRIGYPHRYLQKADRTDDGKSDAGPDENGVNKKIDVAAVVGAIDPVLQEPVHH